MFKRAMAAIALALVAGLVPVFLYAGSAEGAATLPRGFSETRFISSLTAPTAMELAPDGRMFVAQQGGKMRVATRSGRLLPGAFLTVNTDSSGERGLLGLAFDPNYSQNRYIYIYYTAKTPNVHNRVMRVTASQSNPNVAVQGSAKILLELDPLPTPTNHNGGAIHFGRDGKLYIAVGDNANRENSQSLDNLAGKMLRINKDGTIPTDNPFYESATGQNRAIWALGLRNPYTFAVQPGSGRIHINDVGQNLWEEINVGIKGGNYGWPLYEGPNNDPRYEDPIFAYRHGSTATTGCAITGGDFYNPGRGQFPQTYFGDYLFADICGGWIRRYDLSTKTVSGFATGLNKPLDLEVGPGGSLFYLSRGSNAVYRIVYN